MNKIDIDQRMIRPSDISATVRPYYDLTIRYAEDGRRPTRHSRGGTHKIVVTGEEKAFLEEKKVKVHFEPWNDGESLVKVGEHSSEVVPMLKRHGFKQGPKRSITVSTRT